MGARTQALLLVLLTGCFGEPPVEVATDLPVDSDCEPQFWYRDADGDEHGDPSAGVESCGPPQGYVASWDDCDDADRGRWEGLDGFWDADDDGYGADAVSGCAADPSISHFDGDCDDADQAVYPGAAPICGDALDNDCDGLPECERDGEFEAADAVTSFGTPGLSSGIGAGLALDDITGDGVRDLIAASPQRDIAYVLANPQIGDFDPDDAAIWITGSDTRHLGWYAETGNLDGEGTPDLALSAVHRSGDVWTASAFVMAGPVTADATVDDAPRLYALVDYMTVIPILSVGDVVGDDGIDDVVATFQGASLTPGTHAFVVAGPITASGGYVTEATTRVQSDTATGEGPVTHGSAVGDLDGDGRRDVVFGSLDAHRAWVVTDLPDGTADVGDIADLMLYDGTYDVLLGSWASEAGDVDGDGLEDVLISGNEPDAAVGGWGSWLASGATVRDALGGPSADIWDASAARLFGEESAAVGTDGDRVGDLDEDGYAEVFLGSPDWDYIGDDDPGMATIWYGPLEGTVSLYDAEWAVLGGHDYEAESLGQYVTAAGTPWDDDDPLTVAITTGIGVMPTTVLLFHPNGY